MAPNDPSHSSSPSTGVQPPPPAPIPAAQHVAFPNNQLLPIQIRLDRTNYQYWRIQVLAAVRAYDLEGFLLGTIPPPPTHLPPGNLVNPAYVNWQRFDQFLYHWLLNSITEPMMGHILHCVSAVEIWNVFARIFVSRSKVRLLQVQGMLQSTKKGSDSIDEYVLKMKGYADSLAAAGERISEDRLCLYILGGLGPEFEATIVNLTNRSEPLNVQDVHFSLQSQELRLLQQASSSSSSIDSMQANFAGLSLRGNSRPQSRGGRPGGRGQSRGSYSGRSNRQNRPTCQLCGRVGHVVQKCYRRFDINFTGPESTPSTSTGSSTDQPQAYVSQMVLKTILSLGFLIPGPPITLLRTFIILQPEMIIRARLRSSLEMVIACILNMLVLTHFLHLIFLMPLLYMIFYTFLMPLKTY